MNKYGQRLKELREKNGYTQETLAKMLNTSRSRIGMYEQGKRQPDFEMQEAIADLFNVSIDYLFGRENENKNAIDQLYDALEYQMLINSLTPEEREEIHEFTKQLARLPRENRQFLLNLLKAQKPDA